MHEELLTYCRHFDVSLAVISSPMPEMKLYEHLIKVVNLPVEFEMAVEKCLTTNQSDSAARVTDMVKETYARKAAQLCACLGDSDGQLIGGRPVDATGVRTPLEFV